MFTVDNMVKFDYHNKPRFGKVIAVNKKCRTFTLHQADGYRQYALDKIDRIYVSDAICCKVVVMDAAKVKSKR